MRATDAALPAGDDGIMADPGNQYKSPAFLR